jgi:hypothetical protein
VQSSVFAAQSKGKSYTVYCLWTAHHTI